MKYKKEHRSETFLIGALLAIVGGFLDTYTYLVRGHVFANAQTGNIVFLGMYVAKKQFATAFFYIIPVLAFVVGIITAEVLKRRFEENKILHWRQFVLLIEILILLIVTIVPRGMYDTWVNIGISFLCALQVESFRQLNGNAYATTMCTGNLRSGTEHLFYALKDKNRHSFLKSMQYYGIILFFVLGVALGTVMIHLFGGLSTLFVIGLLFVVFFIM